MIPAENQTLENKAVTKKHLGAKGKTSREPGMLMKGQQVSPEFHD